MSREPTAEIGLGEPTTRDQVAVEPSVGVDSKTNPTAEAGHAIVSVFAETPLLAVSTGRTAVAPSVIRTLSNATISFHHVVSARNSMTRSVAPGGMS